MLADGVWSDGGLFLVPTGRDSVATVAAPRSMLSELLLLPSAKSQRLIGLAIKVSTLCFQLAFDQ